MIYLVVENYYDLDSSWSKIIYATEDKIKAEIKRIDSENHFLKEREKAESIFKELEGKNYYQMSDEAVDRYSWAESVFYGDWCRTTIKEVDIDIDISVYI